VRTLGKKLVRLLIYCYLLLLICFPVSTYAEQSNVKDCLENDEECLEIDEETPDQSNDPQNDEHQGQSLFSIIMKIIFTLLVVIILIYVTLRFLNKRHKWLQRHQAIENLGGISLGPNKSIQVIRLGSKMYLIGIGNDVTLLQEIEDETIKQDLLQKHQTDQPFIQSLFQTKDKQDTVNKFKHLFTNELEKIKQNRQQIVADDRQKEDYNE